MKKKQIQKPVLELEAQVYKDIAEHRLAIIKEVIDSARTFVGGAVQYTLPERDMLVISQADLREIARQLDAKHPDAIVHQRFDVASQNYRYTYYPPTPAAG